MPTLKILLLVCLILAINVPRVSVAGTNIDLQYLPSSSVPSGGTGGTSALGAGFGIETMVGSHTGIRIGASYIQRTISGQTWGLIDIPLDINIYPAHWLQLGVGGFFNSGLNTPATFKNTDYGIDGALGIILPLSAHMGIELGGKYLFNLTNIANAGTNTPHQVLGYAGLKFMMGGK